MWHRLSLRLPALQWLRPLLASIAAVEAGGQQAAAAVQSGSSVSGRRQPFLNSCGHLHSWKPAPSGSGARSMSDTLWIKA